MKIAQKEKSEKFLTSFTRVVTAAASAAFSSNDRSAFWNYADWEYKSEWRECGNSHEVWLAQANINH